MFTPIPAGQQPVDPNRVGRTAQIITIALTTGVCVFAAVAISVGGRKPPAQPLLTWLAIAFTVVDVAVSLLLPRFLLAKGVRQHAEAIREDPRTSLAGLYLSQSTTRRSLLEGAAFFNLIAYIMDGQMWTLGIVAVLIVMILVPFPSQTDFENWAEQVRRDLPA